LTVLPISAQLYYKRPLTDSERSGLAEVIEGLRSVYDLNAPASPYVTTPVFAGRKAETAGFDLIGSSVDKCLWIALLASKKELVDAAKDALGHNQFGAQQLINIGIMPSIAVPALFEQVSAPPSVPHVWEISTGREVGGQAEYLTLDRSFDSTGSLARRG